MTKNRKKKQAVRARMEATGQRYTTEQRADDTMTFTWRIEYSDDGGQSWQLEIGPDAQGVVRRDLSIIERLNIFQVGCTQADAYAAAHRAEHPQRQWLAKVTDSEGRTLGVGAHG